MSSDKWFPGAPSGRVHVETASATGFGGELLKRYGISLGGVSFETVHDSDKVSRTRTRIEGFVLAPPLRGLEGLQLRMALQSMGLKEVKADFDCARHGGPRQGRARRSIAARWSGPGLGEIELTARIVDADAAFWNALDDGDLLALLRIRRRRSARPGWCWPTRACWSAACGRFATMTGQPVATTARQLGARGAALSSRQAC